MMSSRPAALSSPPPAGLPGWPVFDDEQRAAVDAVLRSGRVNYWTGDEARQFEQEYARSLGTPYAVAVANGTVALELALEALDIGPGDEVIVPSRTFLATASAVVVRGAVPVFADIDPLSGNLSAATAAPLVTRRTRAIIAVHVAGWPCELQALEALARDANLALIEDCAQSHGAEYRGRPVGAWGTIGCFSFCQDKILTTGGEGGLVVTRDERLWRRMWSYKDHGKDYDVVHRQDHPGLFRWLHESIGTNWRLTEMQAAIGRVQLRRLPEWVQARRQNAAELNQRLADVPGLEVLTPPDHVRHSYYKYYLGVRLPELAPGWTRDQIARELQALGVPCGPGSCCEIYRERALRRFAPAERLPHSRRYSESSLMLLVHPTLAREDMTRMAEQVRSVLECAARDRPRARAA